MEVSASWQTNNIYYRQYYQDWVKYISKKRKRAVPLALLIMACGGAISISCYFAGEYLFVIGCGIMGVGLSNLIWYFFDKRKWLRSLSSSDGTKESVTLTFTEAGIEHSGPTAQGTVTWAGIKNIVEGNNGLFLIVQKGLSIYIPYSAIHPQGGVSNIIQMFESYQHSPTSTQ